MQMCYFILMDETNDTNKINLKGEIEIINKITIQK